MQYIIRPKNLFQTILEARALSLKMIIFGGVIGAGLFGLVQGAYTGKVMLAYGAIKIPLVIMATTLVCLPAMYVFSFLFGSKFSVSQLSNLVIANLYLLSLGLCALVPVVWFSQNFYHDYRFNVMILVVTFATAWLLAIYQMWKNLKASVEKDVLVRILSAWALIFAFVSTQIIWLFRPWVGYTYIDEKLPFIRKPEGNVYEAVLLTAQTWLERNL